MSGDIGVCKCGTVSIYDAKRRPRILRLPTVAEQVMIDGNPSFHRLMEHRKGPLQ